MILQEILVYPASVYMLLLLLTPTYRGGLEPPSPSIRATEDSTVLEVSDHCNWHILWYMILTL